MTVRVQLLGAVSMYGPLSLVNALLSKEGR